MGVPRRCLVFWGMEDKLPRLWAREPVGSWEGLVILTAMGTVSHLYPVAAGLFSGQHDLVLVLLGSFPGRSDTLLKFR